MHEQGLIRDVMNRVLHEAQAHKAKKVLKVKVKIGGLSHFTPESFKEHFYHASVGTIAGKAVLEVTVYPAQAKCANCKREFELNNEALSCPSCRSVDFEIISGKDALVESVEVE
jgi:hydrogenase nickel incorporation protein HypA/HybF